MRILDNFSYFSIKTYIVVLTKALLMSTHNVCFMEH